MKYLEYISAANGIAKAKTALVKNNIMEPSIKTICSVAADYDAMSKPCMEKQYAQMLNKMNKWQNLPGIEENHAYKCNMLWLAETYEKILSGNI